MKTRPTLKIEGGWLKIIRLSPVVWQHINLIGIYEFSLYGTKNEIGLEVAH